MAKEKERELIWLAIADTITKCEFCLNERANVISQQCNHLISCKKCFEIN